MEALGEIMQLIDAHSDAMSEGDYLKVCGLMKSVFDGMSKPVSKRAAAPRRRPRVDPRNIHPPDELKRRYRENWRFLRQIEDEVKLYSRELKGLRIRSRVTEAVRAEAGSLDREVCLAHLRESNSRVVRRREELEGKLAALDVDRREGERVRALIRGEINGLVDAARAVNPGIDYRVMVWG
jgi:hypothetical protein